MFVSASDRLSVDAAVCLYVPPEIPSIGVQYVLKQAIQNSPTCVQPDGSVTEGADASLQYPEPQTPLTWCRSESRS